MVRSGRRSRLVIVVIAVVQQISFERRIEHVNVQILERSRPTLVQHLQHIGQLVVLARMLPRMMARVVVHLMVRMMGRSYCRVVRMMARMVMTRVARMTVVLLTVAVAVLQGRRVMLHVLRGNVLLLLLLGQVWWGGSCRTVTAAAAATVGVGLHRFGGCGRVVRLPAAPDAGTRLRRSGRVRRRLARSRRTELGVRGPRR